MKYLYCYTLNEFKEFVELDLKTDNWWIYNDTIENRYSAIINKDYFKILNQFAKKEKRESRYQEKLNQVICYKELLSNALPKHVEIATYTFPIQPETDENGNSIFKYSPIAKEDKFLNYDNCYYLGQFIKQFFATTNQSAFDELNKIKDDFIIKINKKKKESSKSFTSNNNYYNDLPF